MSETRHDELPSTSIDIGLPVHNGADTVARAIDSVRAQTHCDFWLLVSDDASTDYTCAIVAVTRPKFARRTRRPGDQRRPQL